MPAFAALCRAATCDDASLVIIAHTWPSQSRHIGAVERLHRFRRGVSLLLEDVAIHPQPEARVSVADLIGDRARGHPGQQHHAGGGVAQAVEMERPQLPRQPLEPLRQPVRGQQPPVRAGEDQVVVLPVLPAQPFRNVGSLPSRVRRGNVRAEMVWMSEVELRLE
jgi:hypothetical protein